MIRQSSGHALYAARENMRPFAGSTLKDIQRRSVVHVNDIYILSARMSLRRICSQFASNNYLGLFMQNDVLAGMDY